MKKHLWMVSIAVASVLQVCAVAHAQDFPSRPIRVVVPYQAGGGVDATLRRIVQKVVELGTQAVVENRGGAGGTIGAMAVKTAAPDGYTLLQGDHATHAANVTLIKDLPYDPVRDFQPITLLFISRTVLFVPSSLPARSVKELVQLVKARPQGLSYASQGVGSGGHLAGALLAKAIGAPLVHVPYKGGGAVRADILKGRVDMLFNNYASYHADVEAGSVRPLAVAAGERLRNAPNVPTMAEAGFPGVELETWFGLFAPAGTDPQIVQTLHRIFTRAVGSPDITEVMTGQGFTVKTGTSAQFAALIKEDIQRMAVLIKEAGALPN
jgi:tripartite-type tricarboxylate transporter receptor subunit TctC